MDLSVFDVQLGHPLALPHCSPGVNESGPCVIAGQRGAELATSVRTSLGRPTPAGTVDVPVRVPRAQCPAWLARGVTGCTVMFTTKDGYVTAAFLPVGDSAFQSAIEDGMSKKYKKRARDDADATCPVRVWSVKALRVTYAVRGARCGEPGAEAKGGVVQVMTRTYRRLLHERPTIESTR